jgi:glutathione S-transferase
MTVNIRGIPGSPFVRGALLGLIEKGAPYRVIPMAPGSLKTPEHFARHPFGRIPVMEDGDFQLYETQAILRYVDLAFPGPSLTPADPKAAARMQQVMNVHDWYAFPSIGAGVTFNRIVAPRLGFPVNEEAVANALPACQTCKGALEVLLGDQPYFTGDKVSLADLLAAPVMDMFGDSPEGAAVLKGSALGAWLERMRARPSMMATTWDAVEKLAAA